MALVTDIYSSTQHFPKGELSWTGVADPACCCINPSNIAEGQGRLTRGEFRQFLGHARGSLFELDSQILIARNLGYLCEGEAARLVSALDELGRMISGLLNSLEHHHAI